MCIRCRITVWFLLSVVERHIGLSHYYFKSGLTCVNLFLRNTNFLELVIHKKLAHREITSDSFIPQSLAILQNLSTTQHTRG